jgi:hypothetical protein
MSGNIPGTTPTPGNASASFAGLPVQQALFLTSNGTMSTYWYRFFQLVWNKIASGISNEVTLGGVMTNTVEAIETLNTDITNETNRATAAEANLQTQIGEINNQNLDARVTTLETKIDGLAVGAVAATPPVGTPVASLNITINGVAYVLPLYT